MRLNIDKIEGERKRLGMSKSEFAERIGINVSTYYRMRESKIINVIVLANICEVLHMRQSDLVLLNR
jgi:DNA-binding Xre family transcriptional regulator